jgi:hypothetical protein
MSQPRIEIGRRRAREVEVDAQAGRVHSGALPGRGALRAVRVGARLDADVVDRRPDRTGVFRLLHPDEPSRVLRIRAHEIARLAVSPHVARRDVGHAYACKG